MFTKVIAAAGTEVIYFTYCSLPVYTLANAPWTAEQNTLVAEKISRSMRSEKCNAFWFYALQRMSLLSRWHPQKLSRIFCPVAFNECITSRCQRMLCIPQGLARRTLLKPIIFLKVALLLYWLPSGQRNKGCFM